MLRRAAICLTLAACGRFHFGLVAGDDAVQIGDGSRPDIVFTSNVVFVTGPTIVPGTLGGLTAADAACQAAANQASLPGTYIAWLSLPPTNAIDRLANWRGWVRTDGLPFADTPQDIVSGKIYAPISLLADGTEQALAGGVVVTGTDATGIGTPNNCTNWTTTTSGSTAIGIASASGPQWTASGLANTYCPGPTRLYCFGVGNQVAVSPPVRTGRRAFVSTIAPSGGGVTALDAKCNADAAAVGLTGTYSALVALGTAGAISRFDTSGARWERLDGIPLAPTAADLALGLRVALDIGADGIRITSALEVWTGAAAPNVASTNNCVDWTSNSNSKSAITGDARSGGGAGFSTAQRSCTEQHAYYCLER